MSGENMHWYRSRVDWWIGLLLCLPPIASLAVCVSLWRGDKAAEWPWALGAIAVVGAIYGGLVFPLRYGIDDRCLCVRFGVCRQRIPLAEIREVYPTHNPLSSPALSLARLHIQFGEGLFRAVMISPADRDGFLDELARQTGLTRTGDRLTRA